MKLHNILAGSALVLTAVSCAEYQKEELPPYTLHETVYADKTEEGNYLLSFNETGNWKVFSGPSSENINWEKSFTPEAGKNELKIQNEDSKKRLFFAAVKDTDTLFISEREIDMENTVNFRDMGGIHTKEGRHTRWGMLYRSGEISELTKEDLAYMQELGLKTILDLRSDVEIEDKPDMYPDGVNWIHLPIGDLQKKDTREMLSELKNADPETFNGDILMEEANESFVKSTAEFKAMFEMLLSEDKENLPLMFHCTAGKDRTGFSSALILSALDVDQKTIMDEYLLSNYFRYGNNEEMLEKAATYYGIDHRILRPMMGVKQQFLQKGLDLIDQNYGSMDTYLEQELGVDSIARVKLKAIFLD